MNPNAMNIYVAKTTEDFLEKVAKIEQTWSRQMMNWAYVGDDDNNIVSIDVNNLDKEKYYWSKGKVYGK